MYFFIQDQTLCCGYKGYTVSKLAVKLEYRGSHYDMLSVASGDWEIEKSGRAATALLRGLGKVRLTAVKADGGLVLRANLRLQADFTARKCFKLHILGCLPVRATNMLLNSLPVSGVHDFQMCSATKCLATVQNQREDAVQYLAFKGRVGNRKGYYGVLGFTTFNRYFGDISLCENGEFAITTVLEDKYFRPNDSVITDDCYLYIERGNVDVLSVYGKKIAKDNPLQKRCDLPTGWCSWYYYGGNISQEIILENMAEIKKYALPVQYIQIDDGWQKAYGDWEANDRFPMGMKALADEIYKAGFTPGIWITPFNFAENSKVFQERPDWFIRQENGELHPNRYIDYSVKGAREWLYGLARKISVEWGYRYIKIDLVSYQLAQRGYKKKGFNALKNFREMLKIIRSAVTEDTALMACTSPIGPSAGLADCARISGDIFERWESLREVAKQTFRRYFVGEFMNTDPDCLMVRGEGQHDGEAFRICTRNEREVRTFVRFISASGGAVMLADKLSLLKAEDIEGIKWLFPINPKPAKPLDLFEREVPSVLYYGKREGVETYAVFNWENVADTFTLSFGEEEYVKEYDSGEVFAPAKQFSLTLEGHDSQIIYAAKRKDDLQKTEKYCVDER